MKIKENTNKPYLLTFSIIVLLISLPIAKFIGNRFGPEEDLLGYNSLGVVLIVLIFMLSLGFIIGLTSIYRNEQPKILSFLAPILNGVALLWLLWSFLNLFG